MFLLIVLAKNVENAIMILVKRRNKFLGCTTTCYFEPTNYARELDLLTSYVRPQDNSLWAVEGRISKKGTHLE